MSYEGREQHICENGHLFEIHCQYSFDDEFKTKCTYCDGFSAWCNHIDDTNGECHGEIFKSEFDKLLIYPAKYETCNLGHQHLTSPAVYKIPQLNELQKMFMTDGGMYYPIDEYNKYHGIQEK